MLDAPLYYLGDTLKLDLEAYSVDCSGYNPIEADIYVHVDQFLNQQLMFHHKWPLALMIPWLDLFAQDTLNPDDTLYSAISANFDFQGTYVVPQQDLSEDIIMRILMIQLAHSVHVCYNYDPTTNVVYADSSTVALRYCCRLWLCFSRRIWFNLHGLFICLWVRYYAGLHMLVEMPIGLMRKFQYFTPNGDGENDFYQLAGQSDPCFDVMDVKSLTDG